MIHPATTPPADHDMDVAGSHRGPYPPRILGYTQVEEAALLLEREALEEAREAVRFHADALATALTERASLDGPWGWLARLWRTHERDVAHCDARIAYHHQHLQQAKARLARASDLHVEASPIGGPEGGPDLLEAVATRLQELDHPLRDQLRELDAQLATLAAAHALDARLHQTGTALVSAVRSQTESTVRGLTGIVAGWLNRREDLDALAHAFARACDEAVVPFEGGTSHESQADQAEHVLASLRDRAIDHVRERRMLESNRARVLREASEILPPAPSSSPTPHHQPDQGSNTPTDPSSSTGR
jgi:hypothetical protein